MKESDIKDLIYTGRDITDASWDGVELTLAGVTEFGAQHIALSLLAQMDGLTVWQIKQVLVHAQ